MNTRRKAITILMADDDADDRLLAKDASFSFTFTTAGDYSYLCSIHPNMKAKVIVKPVG